MRYVIVHKLISYPCHYTLALSKHCYVSKLTISASALPSPSHRHHCMQQPRFINAFLCPITNEAMSPHVANVLSTVTSSAARDVGWLKMSRQQLSSASEPQLKRPRDQPIPMCQTTGIAGRKTLPSQIIFSFVRKMLSGEQPIHHTLALTTMCVLQLSHRYQFRPFLKKITPLNLSLH